MTELPEIGIVPCRRPPRALGVSDLRGFLLGTWRLARSIDDRRGGQAGSLRGQASFLPEGAGLRYREAGRLCLGGHAGLARQAYYYRFPRPHLARVCFADARPFHDLDLSAGAWEARHLCGADTYWGRFQVLGVAALSVRWAVKGPRKDYVLYSRYRRAKDPAG